MRQWLFASLAAALVLGLVSPIPAADEARAIIDKAIKAHKGKGKEKGAKFTALQIKMKGKIEEAGGADFTQEVSVQYPNKFKQVMSLEVNNQNITITTVHNGKDTWVNYNGQNLKLDKKKLKAAVEEGLYLMNFERLSVLKDKKFKLSTLGETKVNGKPAVGVKVSCKGHKDVDLYFDKKTGLLAKLEYRTVDFTTEKERSEERIILEYQDVEGRKTAKKVLMNRDGKKYLEAEITEVTQVEKLDDSEFAEP